MVLITIIRDIRLWRFDILTKDENEDEQTTHRCNICNREMTPADDIPYRGSVVKGYRCKCGNVHRDYGSRK